MTPGPWTIVQGEDETKNSSIYGPAHDILGSDGHFVAHIVWKPEDARLIAAAPELLAIAEAFAEVSVLASTPGFAFRRMRDLDKQLAAAITKATS